MVSESTRTLVSWPSQFVDVGLYFFSAVAVHETARRRLPSALMSTLLALLCKELAVIPALLLPWFPDGRPRAERRRWAIAFGALIVVWAAAYLAVRRVAVLHLPHGLEQDPGLLRTPLPRRLAWALGGLPGALPTALRFLGRTPSAYSGPLLLVICTLSLAVFGALYLILTVLNFTLIRRYARFDPPDVGGEGDEFSVPAMGY